MIATLSLYHWYVAGIVLVTVTENTAGLPTQRSMLEGWLVMGEGMVLIVSVAGALAVGGLHEPDTTH